MEKKQYTISVAAILDQADGFIQYMHDTRGKNVLGSDINPGLDVLRVMDPGERVPVDMVLPYYDAMCDKLGDPHIGIKVIEHLNANKISAFTFIRDGYYHFVDALKMYKRYIAVNNELTGLEILETDDGITLNMVFNAEYTRMSYHKLEGAATFMVAFLKYVNAPMPYKIHFDHLAPTSDTSIYKKSLGMLPIFDQPETAFFFKKSDCRAMVGLGTQNESITSHIGRLESNLKRTGESESNTEKVSFVLRQLMYLGEPSKEQLASVFGVTSRTLHRYLSKENTTFNEVLTNIRKEASIKYLEEDDFNCNEIAFLLSYKDNSQFYKSFKSWYKVSTLEYKKSLGLDARKQTQKA